jgi:hypothetical protein
VSITAPENIYHYDDYQNRVKQNLNYRKTVSILPSTYRSNNYRYLPIPIEQTVSVPVATVPHIPALRAMV